MTAEPIAGFNALVLALASVTCFQGLVGVCTVTGQRFNGNNMRRAVPVTNAASRLGAYPLSFLTTSACSSPTACVGQHVRLSSSSAAIHVQIATATCGRKAYHTAHENGTGCSTYQTTQNTLRRCGLKRKGAYLHPPFPQTMLLKLRHLEAGTEVSYVTLQTATGVAA